MKADPVRRLNALGIDAGDLDRADCRGMRVGILVVAYNAVGTLVSVLNRIPKRVWQNIEEVAVFDDASGDSTYELAVGYKTLADQYKLQIVRNRANLGYGGNQKAGYRYFMDKGFDAVVLLHGDGQYAPEILHHLYGKIVAGEADAVLGSRMTSRYGTPLGGGMPLYKYVGNRILSEFENRALGMQLSEFHSGYRAYSLRALRNVALDKMTDDFHFDTEIIVKLHHQGFRIAEVPIPTYYGDEICYVNGMKYAYDVVRAVRRYRSTVRSARCYPEFEEYFVRYPVKEAKYSSHSIVQRLVGSNQDVLDLGCGEGYFAESLRRDGNRVSGIDVIPVPRRREAFAAYCCANLNHGVLPAAKTLSTGRYDAVLAMDVLQRLPHPENVLRDAATLLKENGRVVIALANVANVTVRAALAFGRFDYTQRGILDRNHLRFYTRKTARDLLERCGYEICSERASVMPLEMVLDVAPRHPAMRALHTVLGWCTNLLPGLLGYQWILVARPKRTPETS
ncbi:MAG TPA: bifunctional glycosyltransferase/class I SAM-dependent methyltransferase [Candidatus Acidoferrales bacterium]|nr:bifunctional glycosyltransferase/class I SAM-dependent methyltransferase [Candidatus Acidoferrales bacterium]